MEKLPDIVRERLKGSVTAAAEHPDADLLTAFAEQSLGEGERVRVMKHLAGCGECREVLALAMAGNPEVASTVAPISGKASSAKATWFSFSLLRWGTAGALAVIVGAAVLLRDQHKGASTSSRSMIAVESTERRTEDALAPNHGSAGVTASLGPEAAQPNNLTMLPAETKKQRESSQPKGRRDGASNSNALVADAVTPPPAGKDQARALAQGSQALSADSALALQGKNVPGLEQKQTAGGFDYKAMATPKPAAPSVAAAGGFDDANPGKAKEEIPSAAVAGRIAAEKSRAMAAKAAPENSQVRDESSQAIAQTSESVEVTAAAPAPQSSSPVARNTLGRARPNLPGPRWTISADGQLERSLDTGKTWEKISIPGNNTFRALSVIGGDIWVGGDSGALFHSSDAARNWLQVVPSVDGVNLTSDIAHIEFSDLRHGKVATGGGETWTTSDGGQSWQRN